MVKKGQVSFFLIIIAIVFIIAGFNLILSMDSSKILKPTSAKYDTAPVSPAIEACISNLVEDAVFINSYSAGYYDMYRYDGSNMTFPYLFYYNISYMPSLSTVETAMASYINANFRECINLDSTIKSMNVTFDGQATDFKVSIRDKSINVNAVVPITMAVSGKEVKASKFFVSVPMEYKKVYDSAAAIISFLQEDPEVIPVSVIQEFALENGFFYNAGNTDNGTLLNNLEFKDFYNGKTLIFAYAVKYNWTYST